MDKKLASILVSMLMCATVLSVAVTGNNETKNNGSIILDGPPSVPDVIAPSEAPKGVEIPFYFNSTDPNGEDVYYVVDWGFENWHEFGPFPSGEWAEVTHIFRHPHYVGNKTWEIYVKANGTGGMSAASGPHYVTTENHAPDAPIVSGPGQAFAGEPFTLEFIITDTDNDINLALGVKNPTPQDPNNWDWEGNYDNNTIVEKSFVVDDPMTKTYRFRVGERRGYNGNIACESNITLFTIEILEKPNAELVITDVQGEWGGFGKGGVISANIVEITGEYPAENVEWTIEVVGGVLGRINVHASGTIDEIPLGGTESISTTDAGKIFGLGSIDINITVIADFMEEPVNKQMTGNILGPFIINIRDA